jgi:hypothetical protein
MVHRVIQRLAPSHAKRGDPVTEIAALIADASVTESKLLDDIRVSRNPKACIADTKGRHYDTITILLGFYCCMCGDYLRQNFPGPLEPVMTDIVNETVHLSLDDFLLDRPRFFARDLPGRKGSRYQGRGRSYARPSLTSYLVRFSVILFPPL